MNANTIIKQYAEGIRYFGSVDLAEENLENIDLSNADLAGSYLDRANLSRANLYKTCLRGADLSEANLDKACLDDANLAAANLQNVTGSFTYDGAFFCKTEISDGEVSSSYDDP